MISNNKISRTKLQNRNAECFA